MNAYYLTGGVHAREWGSCEILVNVATDLCAAYSGGTGIGYGGKYFSAAEVRALIEQFNIIIFPMSIRTTELFSNIRGVMAKKP